MSTAQLSKKEHEAQTKYLRNWKVCDIINLLEMYIDDDSIEHLIAAEFELKNMISGILADSDPNDPPF